MWCMDIVHVDVQSIWLVLTCTAKLICLCSPQLLPSVQHWVLIGAWTTVSSLPVCHGLLSPQLRLVVYSPLIPSPMLPTMAPYHDSWHPVPPSMLPWIHTKSPVCHQCGATTSLHRLLMLRVPDLGQQPWLLQVRFNKNLLIENGHNFVSFQLQVRRLFN